MGGDAEAKALNLAELRSLREIVAARKPSMLPLVDRLGVVPLRIEEREELRDILADELCETGLDLNDEPNARGVLIDRIIGRLMRY